jgi:hypothetical protein
MNNSIMPKTDPGTGQDKRLATNSPMSKYIKRIIKPYSMSFFNQFNKGTGHIRDGELCPKVIH